MESLWPTKKTTVVIVALARNRVTAAATRANKHILRRIKKYVGEFLVFPF